MVTQPVRVILADDHDLIRAGIRNALQDSGSLEVISEVADGPKLRQALAEFDADLLLMDVNMPKFEALTEIHVIRQQYPQLFILVVSAYDDDIYVQGLLSAGANG